MGTKGRESEAEGDVDIPRQERRCRENPTMREEVC